MDSIRRECIKTTCLLLGVAKYKKSETQRMNSIRHECIKPIRLLSGVEKFKESWGKNGERAREGR